MSFYEDEPTQVSIYDRALLSRFWTYMRPYSGWLAISVISTIALAVLEILPWLLVQRAIDDFIIPGEIDGMNTLFGQFLVILVLIFILRYGQTWIMMWIGQKIIKKMRMELFTHIEHMSASFFDKNPVGRLVTRLTGDIQQIEMVVSQGVVQILSNLLIASTMVLAMYLIYWKLALLLTIFLIPLIWVIRRFAAAQREAFRDQRLWMARIGAYLNEIITGVTVIQLFNRQKTNLRMFDERNQGALDSNMRVLFWFAAFEPVVIIFTAITTASIIWYGGGEIVRGAITLGILVQFLGYINRFFWPVRDLTERYTMIQGAVASAERVFAILDTAPGITDVKNTRSIDNVKGKLEFDQVWFAYNEENWVLKDVSFVINPGETVAIVGATGAGKSTTMALFSRFYDVQKGEIRVDDVPVKELPQSWLRRHTGIMLQDPWVFTDTIEANVRMRDPSISSHTVRQAAEAVGANIFIEKLSEGYNTHMSERGANFSTGQKQLISLARVAAFDPQIVLVMDEATASIDPETEAIIQEGLANVMEGRTSVIIAHRLNTIRNVDRILVFHQGELVEDGTHEELMENKHIYSQLYELQYGVPPITQTT
ncbi:MAG: ABC transporter ATP-binding protein/permease [Dehalococcoidia bacterium]|nr:ABC transporter ATP-binding protein/permease [Dehalococcoidia bacterium]|tara:strand:+ start:1762 stop:3552 length:1791 start_codon:yes stop_codon:yes gene_type:complete